MCMDAYNEFVLLKKKNQIKETQISSELLFWKNFSTWSSLVDWFIIAATGGRSCYGNGIIIYNI